MKLEIGNPGPDLALKGCVYIYRYGNHCKACQYPCAVALGQA